jgi:hypothetical protein
MLIIMGALVLAALAVLLFAAGMLGATVVAVALALTAVFRDSEDVIASHEIK